MLKSEYPTFVPEELASALLTVGILTVEELMLLPELPYFPLSEAVLLPPPELLYPPIVMFPLLAAVVPELPYFPLSEAVLLPPPELLYPPIVMFPLPTVFPEPV